MNRGAMLTSDRRGHVDNVIPLRRPVAVSVTPVVMYDREAEPAEATVTITVLQASLIASLIRSLKGHAPSPRACDEAIALLVSRRGSRTGDSA